LVVLKKTVWVFAVATVGGPTRRLNVSDPVRVRTQDTKKRLRMHSASANLNVIWLLKHASSIAPVLLQLKDEVLKSRPFEDL
jgi:hypothetical protein